MNNNLLKSGEFAKLARTTKRTIIWYGQKGILSPSKVNPESDYRLYEPSQIIDFQVIFLLGQLGFSLKEIKEYLAKNRSLKDLFKLKRPLVEKEVKKLQKALKDIDLYYRNLGKNGTLVNPIIKKVKPISIYYLEKKGPYAKIKNYGLELMSYFKKVPKNFLPLSIFKEVDYSPKNARMEIGIVKQNGLRLKRGAENIVKELALPYYKCLSYTHYGSGVLVSLLWQELGKYRRKYGYQWDDTLGFADLEFYHLTSLNKPMDEEDMIFELHLPIK